MILPPWLTVEACSCPIARACPQQRAGRLSATADDAVEQSERNTELPRQWQRCQTGDSVTTLPPVAAAPWSSGSTLRVGNQRASNMQSAGDCLGCDRRAEVVANVGDGVQSGIVMRRDFNWVTCPRCGRDTGYRDTLSQNFDFGSLAR